MNIDPKLEDFASPTQKKHLQVLKDALSFRDAARQLGLSPDTVRVSYQRLEAKAAAQGYAPRHGMVHAVPEPFVVKGVSTLRDGEGTIRAQWVKTKIDDQARFEAIKSAFETMADALPRLEPVPAPEIVRDDLLLFIPITDLHLGMRAWKEEGTHDWSLERAERVLTAAFAHLVENSPAAGTCFIANCGDLLHSDGLLPVTPTSGHVLDQGSSYTEMVRVAIRVFRRLVDYCLAKHQKVVLLHASGNHDLSGAVWLQTLFAALYENDPRVEVLETPQPFYAYQHGKTMLGVHHGHRTANAALPAVFAARFREMWGACTRVYIHVGHRHHVEEKEFSGAKVIQHPTLAPPDSYASQHGYDSISEISAIVYHDRFGQVGRTTCALEMLEAA